MVNNCEKCGKQLDFLEERTYQTPDGKTMRLCLECFETASGKEKLLNCKICKEPVERGQKFIVNGVYPTLKWETGYRLKYGWGIQHPAHWGTMYHEECYINKIIRNERKL